MTYTEHSQCEYTDPFQGNRWEGGRGNKIYCTITIDDLTRLFSVSKRTLYRWIKQKKLDPTNIESIVELKQSLTVKS